MSRGSFADSSTWRVHPARRRPLAACAALVVIAAFAGLAAISMNRIGWGLFAATVMIFATRRFFFPTRYTLDSTGIAVRTLFGSRHHAWLRFGGFVHDEFGGRLLARGVRSPFRYLRSVPLLFDGNGAEIAACIETHLAESTNRFASVDETGAPHESTRANGAAPEWEESTAEVTSCSG